MEGLLATIHDGINRMASQGVLIPKICLTVNEGLFGAGPGGSMSFDNRLDVGVSAKWDITALLSADEEKRRAESKLRQAQLTYDELRAKLAAGVQEARSASLRGREQLQRGARAIQHAAETYLLSDKRLRLGARDSSIEEVLRSIRGLEQVHVTYIEAVSSYNKAQVRLLLLLGTGGHCQGAVTPAATLPPPPAMPALPEKPKQDGGREKEQKKEPAPEAKDISVPRAYPVPPLLPDL
jgi:outer membrane protein TolC